MTNSREYKKYLCRFCNRKLLFIFFTEDNKNKEICDDCLRWRSEELELKYKLERGDNEEVLNMPKEI